MRQCGMGQDKHQSSGLADLAGGIDRAFDIRQRCSRIAEQPRAQRPIGQDRHPVILAKSSTNRTVLSRIVKRHCLVRMHSGLHDVPGTQQGDRHDAMGDQERRLLILVSRPARGTAPQARAWRRR